jgi:hypothetical protein
MTTCAEASFPARARPSVTVQAMKTVTVSQAKPQLEGTERRASPALGKLARSSRAMPGARVPGRGLVYRDERFPTGACDANRSRTARSSPQGAGAKGREANVRPKEHKWAVRQDVGDECASKREVQESLTTFCRAQRRERKEQTPTRGGPRVERRGEVSRGHSSV